MSDQNPTPKDSKQKNEISKGQKQQSKNVKPKNQNDNQKQQPKNVKPKNQNDNQKQQPKNEKPRNQNENQKEEPKQQQSKPPKSRRPFNKNKHSNTQNYRPDSKLTDVPNDQNRNKYSRRKIHSNWERAELPENIYEFMEKQSRGANLSELSRQPISVGDHFQFKHEQFWKYDSKSSIDNELFTLDVDKIANHIACIPFYERNDIDKSLFSEEDIQRLKNIALMNEMSLQQSEIFTKRIDIDEDLPLNITNKCQIKEISDKELKPSVETATQDKDDSKQVSFSMSKEDEDLEAWLMDYLK